MDPVKNDWLIRKIRQPGCNISEVHCLHFDICLPAYQLTSCLTSVRAIVSMYSRGGCSSFLYPCLSTYAKHKAQRTNHEASRHKGWTCWSLWIICDLQRDKRLIRSLSVVERKHKNGHFRYDALFAGSFDLYSRHETQDISKFCFLC